MRGSRGQTNPALITALADAAWTSYDLARRINQAMGSDYVHRTTPHSWCTLGVTPRPPLPNVVARLLSEATGKWIKPADLWPGLDGGTDPVATHEGIWKPWPGDGVAGLPLELDKVAVSTELVCVSGPDLLKYCRRWGSTSPPADARSSAAIREGEPIVDHLQAELTRLRGIDDGWGGQTLLTVVSHHQRLLASLALQFGPTSWQSRRCLEVLAQYTQFSGWLALDLGHQARAQRSFFLALRLCDITGDDDLSALVLSCLATQAVGRGRPQDARRLSELATDRPVGSASATAILWMRRARASAAIGDKADCQQSLQESRTALHRPDETSPPWSYWINSKVVAAEEGRCWIDLGEPDLARAPLSKIVTLSSSGGRDRVLYGAALAQAHLAANELDQACAELQDTARFLPATSSRRCLDLVGQVTQGLATRRLTARHRQVVNNLSVALAGQPGMQ